MFALNRNDEFCCGDPEKGDSVCKRKCRITQETLTDPHMEFAALLTRVPAALTTHDDAVQDAWLVVCSYCRHPIAVHPSWTHPSEKQLPVEQPDLNGVVARTKVPSVAGTALPPIPCGSLGARVSTTHTVNRVWLNACGVPCDAPTGFDRPETVCYGILPATPVGGVRFWFWQHPTPEAASVNRLLVMRPLRVPMPSLDQLVQSSEYACMHQDCGTGYTNKPETVLVLGPSKSQQFDVSMTSTENGEQFTFKQRQTAVWHERSSSEPPMPLLMGPAPRICRISGCDCSFTRGQLAFLGQADCAYCHHASAQHGDWDNVSGSLMLPTPSDPPSKGSREGAKVRGGVKSKANSADCPLRGPPRFCNRSHPSTVGARNSLPIPSGGARIGRRALKRCDVRCKNEVVTEYLDELPQAEW